MSATSSPPLRHSLTSVRFPLPVWPTRVMNVSVTVTPCQERTQMKRFTIDNDNNITGSATQEEAAAATATPFDSFASQQELADLTAQWPGERLLAVWNSLPGVTPVKKFTDRKAAIYPLVGAYQGPRRAGGYEGQHAREHAPRHARPHARRQARAEGGSTREADGGRQGQGRCTGGQTWRTGRQRRAPQG